MHKSLLEYIDVVAEETSPTSIILAVAELMRKEAELTNQTAKTSIFVFLDKLQNAGLPIDYTGLKAYYDADPKLSNVIQQFNDREIEFVGQGDEDEAPDTGAPVGEVPPEKKVNQRAKAALAKRESVEVNLDESTEEYGKSMDRIARDKQMAGISSKDKNKLGKVADMMSRERLTTAVNTAILMFKRSGKGGEQVIPSENFDGFNDNEAMAGIRQWGNWENPQDAYDEEDYDQQDPTDETYENATKIIAQISKQFPDIKFELEVEEKNTMIVSAKHKIKEVAEGMVEFSKMSDDKLKAWIKRNDTDEPGISPVFGQQIKSAKRELIKRGLKLSESINNVLRLSGIKK